MRPKPDEHADPHEFVERLHRRRRATEDPVDHPPRAGSARGRATARARPRCCAGVRPSPGRCRTSGRAEALLLRALARLPGDPEMLRELAAVREQAGDLAGVAAVLEEEADRTSSPAEAATRYLALARWWEERIGRRDRAALFYGRAFRLDPGPGRGAPPGGVVRRGARPVRPREAAARRLARRRGRPRRAGAGLRPSGRDPRRRAARARARPRRHGGGDAPRPGRARRGRDAGAAALGAPDLARPGRRAGGSAPRWRGTGGRPRGSGSGSRPCTSPTTPTAPRWPARPSTGPGWPRRATRAPSTCSSAGTGSGATGRPCARS